MWWRKPYRYLPYDPTDETYFGCGNVVRGEWDYIRTRRASQASADPADAGGSGRDEVLVVAERDAQGTFWIRVTRVLERVVRLPRKPAPADPAGGPDASGTTAPPDLTGIALSGGGIRSASFCLGVLQALAYAGWLRKFDYLSTVSGGGYIGGSLTWLLHKKWKGAQGEEIPYGLSRKHFPYGSYPMVGMEEERTHGAPANWNVYKGRMLRYLRQHARYLTPGDGINIMSLVAVILRNTLFSLFVYGGILVVVFALAWPYLFHPVANAAGFAWIHAHLPWFPAETSRVLATALLLALGLLLLAALYVLLTFALPREISTAYRLRYIYERWMGRLLTLTLVLAVVGSVPGISCWLDAMGHSQATTRTIALSGKDASLGEISFTGRFRRADDAPSAAETVTLTGSAGTAGAFSLAGELKPAARPGQQTGWSMADFTDNLAALVGGLSTLLGAAASLLAFGQAGKQRRLPTGVLVAVASFALIFGLLLLAYHFASMLRIEAIAAGPWPRVLAFPGHVLGELGVWSALGILLALFLRFPNLNLLSIHRYYRDRLMETFTPDLPDAIHQNGPVPGAPKSADQTPLHAMLNTQGGPGELGPYHLINTNVVLVSSEIPKFRGRGGDNFILSPLFCGSNATGWCETKDSPYGSMSLPTAIAISGAAVHSNAGSGGVGITRAPWLSFLMGFFNIRLGYWSDNPTPGRIRLRRILDELDRPLAAPPQQRPFTVHYALVMAWHGLFVLWRWPFNRLILAYQALLCLSVFAGRNCPNAIYPGMLEMYLRKNLDENSRMVQLSDGGHFENLGLYELVRRRLKLIIVCDGTADQGYAFDDLANAMEKVRADFGAIIDFHCPDIETLTPRSVIETGNATGKRVTYATQGFLVGTIIYNDRSTGTILLVATSFFKELTADLYAYRKAHPEFPDQPTGDQFFDEKQFEAYRELGFQTAHRMMTDADVLNNADVSRVLGRADLGPGSG